MDATGWLLEVAKAALGIVPVGLGVWGNKWRYRMSVSRLQTIQRGRTKQPPRLLVYGTPGVGKSTFAAQAPNPIFIPTEDGLGEIDCARFPLATTYDDVRDSLRSLASDQHNFETVVIDSLDWLERLLWERLCQDYNVKSIEKVDGGYGKGYTHALAYWAEILGLLKALREQRGMAVILIAHTKIEKFADPEATTYDRYSPRLHEKAGALVSEWVDAVLFATRKFRTQAEDAGFNRKRAIALAVGKDGGDRIIRCIGGPSCVAKNRYSITEELPLSWAAFVAALSARLDQE